MPTTTSTNSHRSTTRTSGRAAFDPHPLQRRVAAERTGHVAANLSGRLSAIRACLEAHLAGAPSPRRLACDLATMAREVDDACEWLESIALAEGLTIPAQVNFVAKGANILKLGYQPSGATAVAMTHLNTSYLWDRVRVQGGAYGSGTGFTEVTGSFVFTSYRDPNLLQTLDIYDGAGGFLRRDIEEAELTRSIIGVIGRMDAYQLPDAKGYTAMIQALIGETPEHRQQRRDEVLGAKLADFKALADILAEAAKVGQVAVVGSEAAIKAANDERGGFLKVTRVL